MKSLEKEVRRLQEQHAARNADLTSQIAALTAEKAAVERRMAAQVRSCLRVLGSKQHVRLIMLERHASIPSLVMSALLDMLTSQNVLSGHSFSCRCGAFGTIILPWTPRS